MKLQELNATEMKEVNGGGLFGGDNSTSGSENAFAGDLGIGNLLSYSSESRNGDQSKSSSFSAGNGITASVGSLLSNITRSV